MFAILAEDDSDAEALAHLVRRHFNNDHLPIKRKGYGGCGGLCAKGARDIKSWLGRGVTRFVVCHDADSNPPGDVREKVFKAVVRPSQVPERCCVTIPVEEIEAWLIADEAAVTRVIPTFRFGAQANPESILNPKDWLINESRKQNGKPLYSPKTFNAAVAKHVRFDIVAKKCPSFRAFIDCLTKTPLP